MIPQSSSANAEPQLGRTSRYNVTELRNHIQRMRLILSEPDSSWYESVQSRLEELVDRLPFDWDGYGSGPVSFLNANFALSMLNSICLPDTAPPQIVPGTDGDLQIEWHTNEVDIELAVHSPYVVHAWRYIVGGDPEGESLDLTRDFTDVANWVAAMSEQQIVANTAAA